MGGVGTETAKNIVLAGPGRVVIHDDAPVTPADLGVSFLLTAEHIGKGRAEAALPGLVELNLDMKVESHTGEITTDFLSQFVAVVVTNHHPLAQLIEWDEFCRTKNILFILAQSTGAFTNMFSDFGDAHHITD
jgi:ubiquitin-activating enzyme E1